MVDNDATDAAYFGGIRYAFRLLRSADPEFETCEREHDSHGYHIGADDEVNPCDLHATQAALPDSPLSGEWAGDPTDRDVVEAFDPENGEGEDAGDSIVTAWLDGYGDVAGGIVTIKAGESEDQLVERLL